MRYLARVGGERDGGREMAVEIGRRVTDRTAGGEGEAARGARRDVRVDGRERRVEARLVGEPPGGDGPHRPAAATAATLVLTIDGRPLEAIVVRERSGYSVTIGGRIYAVALEDPQRRAGARTGPVVAGRVEVRAVMPGKIVAVLVEAGQQVAQGQV